MNRLLWQAIVFALMAGSCGRDALISGLVTDAGGSAGGGSSVAGGAAMAGGRAGGGPGGGTAGGPSSLPDVMLLLDLSGSLNTPIDVTSPTCGGCTGSSCPSSCPTRISVLRSAALGFVGAQGVDARFGLASYPANADFMPTGCAPFRAMDVMMLPAGLGDGQAVVGQQNDRVLATIANIGSPSRPVTGGSPLSATLPALVSEFRESTRRRVVLLVTDGLPNCNPNNPLACTSVPPPPVTLCTIGVFSANFCTGEYCRTGYLDQPASVAGVKALRQAGITVAVVLLDPQPTNQVVEVMNALADEGGATACTGCARRFFQGSTATDLALAMTAAFRQATAP